MLFCAGEPPCRLLGRTGIWLRAEAPGELTLGEMKRCMAIIEDGGTVSLRTMKPDLPRSQMLAIARYRTEIVAVGAIKPVRKDHAAAIAAKSRYSFPADTPELGYVAIDAVHQGHGLSHKITRILLSRHTGQLFATTDSPRMKENSRGCRVLPRRKRMGR